MLKCILANKRYTTVVFSTLLLLVCPRKYLYLCVWCLHIHASVCGFGFVWMCLHDCACVNLPAFCFLVTICNAHACITYNYKESRWNCVFPAAVSCGPAPKAPENGHQSGSGTTFGSRVTYTCNQGYYLQGDNRRTCMANGQWSGVTTRCTRKQYICWTCWFFWLPLIWLSIVCTTEFVLVLSWLYIHVLMCTMPACIGVYIWFVYIQYICM